MTLQKYRVQLTLLDVLATTVKYTFHNPISVKTGTFKKKIAYPCSWQHDETVDGHNHTHAVCVIFREACLIVSRQYVRRCQKCLLRTENLGVHLLCCCPRTNYENVWTSVINFMGYREYGNCMETGYTRAHWTSVR